MTIELKPEHQRIIEDAVRSGRCHNVDEFLGEAIAAWKSVTGASERRGPHLDSQKAQAAAARIRELRQGISLGGLTIRELISEGRR